MIGETSAKFDDLTLAEAELVDATCDRFETEWRAGDRPGIASYLGAVAGPCRNVLLLELIKREIELRVREGQRPTAEEYRPHFPDQVAAIAGILREMRADVKGLSSWPDGDPPPDEGRRGRSGADVDADASTIDLDPGQLIDPPQLDLAIGRQLGDYVILERIGSGGMGVVYRALQRSANRFVALKLIKADWWGDSTDVSSREAEVRFRNEAQAHAQLDHDHIVPIYDVGHVGGILFFSMRLIKGRSLGQVLLSDGPLPPRRAAYYVEAIARAVQYAHDRRVLHRDVKPGNILVDENDRPYLIDLGLAKSLEATDYSTLSGKAIGTAEYMSPEQARGEKEIDFPTDVYGLGATLFSLLTGRPPFTGPNPIAVLRQVIDDEPSWPRERNKAVGPELKAICLKCLEKDPARRIASAGELADELGKYLRYERCKYTLPGPWTRLTNWGRRQPWRAAAAGLAVAALLIAGSAWTRAARRDRATAEDLLNDLRTIPMGALPRKIEQMAGYRGRINPGLHAILADHRVASESRTRALLALLPTEPEWANELTDRLLTCEEPQEHRAIREALRDRREEITPRLHEVLDRPRSDDPARRTRASAALIALGPPVERAWSELSLAPDPGPRVELIEWLIRSKVDPRVLVAHLETERDPSIRLGAIQCLADLEVTPSSDGIRAHLPRLLALYRDDHDPGVHSSIAYLLRRWGQGEPIKRIDAELAGRPRGANRWYVNSQGQTMVVVGAGSDDRSARPLPQQFAYRFAIASTETTLGQYHKFDPAHRAKRDQYTGSPHPNPDAPADLVSYNAAASYCNWLSRMEGLLEKDWCYRPAGDNGDMILVPDYLSRKGYRLPDLREWEYAARAGTTTARYFGESLTHVARYAWSKRDTDGHAEPVGLKRPNDFGLFDVIGNLMEWCYNPDPPHNTGCPCDASQGKDCRKVRFVSQRGGCFAFTDPELVARPNHPLLDVLHMNESYAYTGFRIMKIENE